MPPVLLFRPTVKYIELMILWRDALFKVACVDPGLPKSGRGIAIELGRAGMTVYVVGRSSTTTGYISQERELCTRR